MNSDEYHTFTLDNETEKGESMNEDIRFDLHYWYKTYVCDWRLWIPVTVYLLIVIPVLIIHFHTGW